MPLDIQRIRAICFDIDGTLRDTDDRWVQQLTAMLNPLAFLFSKRDPAPFSRRLIMAIESPGNAIQVWLDRLGLDGWVEKLDNLGSRPGSLHKPGQHTLIPGTKEVLIQLQPMYMLAVVSVRSERKVREFLDAFELSSYFSLVAASQTSKHTKPFPDPILWAAQKMQVNPGECLMVGDTTVDIQAGKAAGAQTVGVLNGFGEEKELLRAGADLILPSVADLPAILLAKK
jgi:phosphoglycolate phosphatase-like HAD superfamily hydrolase